MIMTSLELLVSKNHQYRRLLVLLNFSYLCKSIKTLNKEEGTIGRNGYDIVTLFKCIFLQFLEDLSDRQLEKHLQDNNASKLFCGFNLEDKTPHFSLFTKVRHKIGIEKLNRIFQKMRRTLKKKNLILENFTFVDSTHIIRKKEKLDNINLPKVAHDR